MNKDDQRRKEEKSSEEQQNETKQKKNIQSFIPSFILDCCQHLGNISSSPSDEEKEKGKDPQERRWANAFPPSDRVNKSKTSKSTILFTLLLSPPLARRRKTNERSVLLSRLLLLCRRWKRFSCVSEPSLSSSSSCFRRLDDLMTR